MVWFARIEEIEGQNLKDNILVRFWSPQFVFLIFFENQCGFKKLLLLLLANKKRRRRKEAVTDLWLSVLLAKSGNCLPTGIEKRKAHIG